MLTKIDKAFVAGAVTFAAMVISTFFGFTIDPTMQAGIVGLITSLVTFAVPNKT